MAGPSDDSHNKSNNSNKKTMKETIPTFASQVEKFDFCGESIDISLRKLLAKVLLPKEAQQIDRAMEDFAKRYYECNPGLVDNPDMVYAVAFSILLLHTDAHNKNVRQKMNKDTFIMRTKIIEGGEGVAQEILDVMYDNIVMSEFTYADGHKESIGNKSVLTAPIAPTASTAPTSNTTSWFSKFKGTNHNDSTSNTQQSALLADLGQKLEQLMPAENSFSYKRTLKPIPIMEVHFSLLKAKSLCLAGVRSRYSNNSNTKNSSNDNTFTIKVTKAGVLDRKYDLIQGGKKATARGWRPFGIILSGSQIIFFADISSFQNWQENEQNPQNNNLPPRRNNSFPAFSSLGQHQNQQESSSNLSVNATTINSISSLNSSIFTSSTSPIIPTSSTSSSTSAATQPQLNNLLRPVQIVSLSYAICICDEAYAKYPHVFRLITGDGQQFLLRAENDEEMEDWMLKINYAATLKTTGVRMRPIVSSHPGYSVKNRASINMDKFKREEKAKEKVDELSDRIDEQVKLLDRELQLRRNLMVLVPYQKSTKDRIISFADTLGKRIRSKRIELQRLECYRDYLESELAWCMNTSNTSQQARKLSLPLLSNHIYSFTAATTPQQEEEANATTLPLGVGRKKSIKKLTNLVFSATSPSNDTSSPVSNVTSTTSSSSSSSSTSSSSQTNNVSSAVSREDGQHDEEIDNTSSISASNNNSVISTNRNSVNSSRNNNNTSPGSPQLPAFSFPKSFIESLSFMDSTNIKTASDKDSEMDRIMRRRSQSNPILPRGGGAIDKKLLFLEPPKAAAVTGNRQRSGSEASSVKDDDDMSVIIVNDSEEMLVDSTDAWTSTPTSPTTAGNTTTTTTTTTTNLTTVSSSSS